MYRLQPRNWAEARTMLNPEGNEGGGAGNEGRQKEQGSDILARYNGDAVRVAEKLADALNDNYGLRRKRDDLQGEIKTLQANQKPEGATILTGDEAKIYEGYKPLGTPDEIKARLAAGDEASGKAKSLERDGTLRDAAQRYGYDFDALRAHAGDLALTAQEVEEDGKRVTKYRAGEGTAQTDLAEWVAKQPAYVGRALAVADTGQGQQSGGVRYPAQWSGGGAQPPANAADAFFAQKYPSRG